MNAPLKTAISALIILLCTSIKVQAQNPDPAHPETRKPAAEGTFQLIHTGKLPEALNTDLLVELEARRHETDVIYYRLSENMFAKILSKAEINRPGFEPLRELYIGALPPKGGKDE